MMIELSDELLEYLADQYLNYKDNNKVSFEFFVNNMLWLYGRDLKDNGRKF